MVDDQPIGAAIPYEIRIEGHLSETWSDWIEGLTFQHECDGTTILSGEIIDQAALHGVLKIIRDLGMPLVSVNRIQIEVEKKSDNIIVKEDLGVADESNRI